MDENQIRDHLRALIAPATEVERASEQQWLDRTAHALPRPRRSVLAMVTIAAAFLVMVTLATIATRRQTSPVIAAIELDVVGAQRIVADGRVVGEGRVCFTRRLALTAGADAPGTIRADDDALAWQGELVLITNDDPAIKETTMSSVRLGRHALWILAGTVLAPSTDATAVAAEPARALLTPTAENIVASDDLVGRVVDEDGRALADVPVEFRDLATKQTTRVATDATGTFRIVRGATQPISALIVWAPRHAAFCFPVYSKLGQTRASAEGRSVGDLHVVPAQTLTGRVVDASGQGIAQARVSFTQPGNGLTQQTMDVMFVEVALGSDGEIFARERSLPDPWAGACITDSDGGFSYPWLGRGPTRVEVTAAGFGVARVDGVVEGKAIEVQLAAAPPLAGRVVDQHGAPVAGLDVAAYHFKRTDGDREPPHFYRTTTAADGAFVLQHLVPELAYRLQVKDRDRKLLEQDHASFEAPLADLVIDAGASVEFEVHGADGKPYEQLILVMAWDREPPSTEPGLFEHPPGMILSDQRTPDHDGKIRVAFLSEQKLCFQLRPWFGDHPAKAKTTVWLEPRSSETLRHRVDFTSAPRSNHLALTVEDADGHPASRAHVTLNEAWNGREPGVLKWQSDDPVLECGFNFESIALAPDATADVAWSKRGTCGIVARLDDQIGVLDLDDPTDAKAVLRMQPAASLSGRVMHDGQPVPRALVAVWDGHALRESVSADDEGRFSFPVLAARSYYLRAAANLHREAHGFVGALRASIARIAADVALGPGKATTHDVTLLDSRSARIRVRLKSGGAQWVELTRTSSERPLDLFDVIGSWHQDAQQAAKSGRDELDFHGLAAGTYRLTRSEFPDHESEQTVTLADGQEVTMEL